MHPVYEDYVLQEEENEALQEELDSIENYIEELEALEERAEEEEEDIEVLESAFPEDHDTPSLFLYLKEVAENNNLSVGSGFGSFSVEPYVELSDDEEAEGEEHSRIKEISFDITISGDYEDIKNFFDDIEKVARLIRVDEVSISYGEGDPFMTGDETEEDEFDATIQASTYSY